MATTDSVILNFLIKDSDSIKVINSLKTMEKKMAAIISYADVLSVKFGTSMSRMTSLFESFNNMVTQGGFSGEMKFDDPALQLAQIQSAKIDQIRIERENAAREKEANQELIADKTTQMNIEIDITKQKEAQAIAAERAQVAAEKEALKTPTKDKDVGKKLEAESRKEIQEMQKSEVANRQQVVALQKELTKELVVDVDKAREMAMLDDRRITAQRAIASAEGKLSTLSGKTPFEQTKMLIPLMDELHTATGASTDAMLKLVQAMYGIDNKVIENTKNGIHDMKNGIGDTIREMFNLKSIMNTAFGVGMAMVIFQLQMLVTKFFTNTIQQAKDLSNALGKLSIAEQVMSKSGVEVTGGQLLGIVKELNAEFRNVSSVDMFAATGDMALRLAGAGFTPKELKGLMEVANAARIRNPEKSLEEIMGTVSAAAMSGQPEGVRNLGGGLSVADSDVKAYAKKIGMIDDINDKLTEEQKMHARAGVLIEQNNKTLKETLELQDNLANAGDKLSAEWENLTTEAAPLVDYWNALIYLVAYVIEQILYIRSVWNDLIDGTSKFNEHMRQTSPIFGFMIWGFTNILNLIGLIGAAIIEAFVPVIATLKQAAAAYEEVSGKKISEQPSIANLSKQDTPTGPVIPPMGESEDNSEKIQKALNDLAEAMDEFADRAANMEEDFHNTMQKLQEDFDIDISRFMEDWKIDRLKIINDSEKAIEAKQREYNRKKIDAEAKFQEELRQLREKFLMNLDDALHERDARQVLRLIRDYAMNKQNMINEFNLSQSSAAAQHAAEIEEMRRQRDDRLKELDAERALKLKRMEEDFRLKRKREEEEHKIEMQRLEEERKDRLRNLATSLAEQLGLTNEGTKAIQELYLDYFGSKGSIETILKMGYDRVITYTTLMAKKLKEIEKLYKATTANIGMPTTGSLPTAKDMQNAGGDDWESVVTAANKDSALPVGALSALKGGALSLFGNINTPKTSAEILVTLSNDLEARIVQKSTDSVANSIMTVRRNQR